MGTFHKLMESEEIESGNFKVTIDKVCGENGIHFEVLLLVKNEGQWSLMKGVKFYTHEAALDFGLNWLK